MDFLVTDSFWKWEAFCNADKSLRQNLITCKKRKDYLSYREAREKDISMVNVTLLCQWNSDSHA